jgi:alpha-aminoadipic semialdehyde synthase
LVLRPFVIEIKLNELLCYRAKDAGVRVLQECGLDPGLDHCSAQKIIDDIHFRGGQVVSFSSVCGGLPAPEAADNPLKYKFSWSPSGVINASQLPARYRWENQDVQVRLIPALRDNIF